MMNSVNYQNQRIPANYSGVTINISGANGIGLGNPNYCPYPETHNNINCNHPNHYPNIQNNAVTNSTLPQPIQTEAIEQIKKTAIIPQQETIEHISKPISTQQGQIKQQAQQVYPAQYYLNNYNYIQGNEKDVDKNLANTPQKTVNTDFIEEPKLSDINNLPEKNDDSAIQAIEADLSSSKEIISKLESREAEEKELKKNGNKTKVVALTNEYIMSLENYLNNPNGEIRLMASKEVLTRLDEDHNRYNDAALNALLNKMLQDPDKLVRIAAMSALSSGLASGNDYTVELLQKVQQNPNSDPEDVLEAAQILLKRSSTTEERFTPAQPVVQPVPVTEGEDK